jgi:AraC family transcriptional regulator of arabinose operon
MNKIEKSVNSPKPLRWGQFDRDRVLGRATDPRVRFVLECLQDIEEGMQIDVLARAVHLSSSRLRHLFGNQIGISLSHYVKLLQLQRAKKLLETSFLEVKEIAAQVGVNDLSHFIRDYKRVYQETPSQTRSTSCKSHAPAYRKRAE